MADMSKYFAGIGLLLISACSMTTESRDVHSRQPEANITSAQNVVINGQPYSIMQLTDSTWAAVPATPTAGQAVTGSASQRAELVKLIEQRSGCKVTDIDFSGGPGQLDTQVSCAAQQKN
jgi:hypothetical protein